MLNINELKQIINKLNRVFVSEKDFQFALAWNIKERYRNADVLFEYGVGSTKHHDMNIDLVIKINDEMIPIELKYKTKYYKLHYGLQQGYELKNHSAQNFGRYDYLKDIERLEETVNKMNNMNRGYAVILTNEPKYWERPKGILTTEDKSFRIHQGSIITGKLSWTDSTNKKERKASITLEGDYEMIWEKYPCNEDCEFRYAINEIKKQ